MEWPEAIKRIAHPAHKANVNLTVDESTTSKVLAAFSFRNALPI
jgi:hypothetical protein